MCQTLDNGWRQKAEQLQVEKKDLLSQVEAVERANHLLVAQLQAYERELATSLAEDAPIVCESFEMTYSELVANLAAKGLELMRKDKFVPDRLIHSTDAEGWAKIAPNLVLPADLYVEDIADCEDYAESAKARAAMIYKRSGCRYCWGETPEGQHGFCLVMISPTEFRIFESNAGFPWAGELFEVGAHGYFPTSWE